MSWRGDAGGGATPDGRQEFLAWVRWDADAGRDDLQAYAVAHPGEGSAVSVLHGTGFLGKGEKPAGVQRQYPGTVGRIAAACRCGATFYPTQAHEVCHIK